MMGYKIVNFFRSRLFRVLVTLGSFIVIIGVSRSLYSLWQKGDIVAERKNALAKLEQEQIKLKKKLEEAQSPEFIERSAREDLGLIKEGEAIVLVPRTQDSELNDQAKSEENLPNWKKWWLLFF